MRSNPPRPVVSSTDPARNPVEPEHRIDPQTDSEEAHSRTDARVRPDYLVIVDADRKFREVSESFCKLLGYRREELIGKKYDDFTAPMTNDIEIVLELFLKMRYMHGIWVLVHRKGTKIIVRYE